MSIIDLPKFDPPAIEALLEIVSDGVWFWHANTGYVYRSPGWYKMLGYDVHSLDGTVFTWETVIHPDDYQMVMEHFERYMKSLSEAYHLEYRCKTKSGDYILIEDKAFVVERNEDGSVARMIGAHRDIDAQERLNQHDKLLHQELQKTIDERTKELNKLNQELTAKIKQTELLARTDFLTTLSNRYNFEKSLSNEVSRAQRFNEPLSLMIFDLDKFKLINDLHGHAAGDEILISIGKLLRNEIREIDLVSRWGGDEFAILLPNTSLNDAFVVADKLRKRINSELNTVLDSASASFGVVELTKGESPSQLSVRADKALYKSKNAGGNQISSSLSA
ncbi:sensor domain-containing diguanylate cyclase [Methylophaga sp.]|uniref:sensor domain-containing diguanylate cyclase n=1 Tax=Methylophaga sp. TaxID=2024840 RepID=UPI003F6A3B49